MMMKQNKKNTIITYGYDMTKETYAERMERAKKEEAIALLDSQGRHRSEWAYAPYDGRAKKGIPNHELLGDLEI